MRKFLYFFLFPFLLFSAEPLKNNFSPHLIFLVQKGQIPLAIDKLLLELEKNEALDPALLQLIGLKILEEGSSKTPEELLLSLYGARLSLDERAFFVFEKGLSSTYPSLQEIALESLFSMKDDEQEELLRTGLKAEHPLIRLETVYFLALSKAKNASYDAESLMAKFPKELHIFFPKIFCLIGDSPSTKALKKLFHEGVEEVRIESALSAKEFQREDFLPVIRKMATHPSLKEQEASFFALGGLKDESSIPLLKKGLDSPHSSVRLAAAFALFELFDPSGKEMLIKEAKEGNLFAITLLKNMPEEKETLFELTSSSDKNVSLNASLALLRLNDKRALIPLIPFFTRNPKDALVLKEFSPGKAFSCFKSTASASEKFKDNPLPFEISLKIREEFLMQTVQLPLENFLELADFLFFLGDRDLIPTVCQLLELRKTPACIHLLKKYAQKAGDPFTRVFCTLSLYRLKEEGSYEETLCTFIKDHNATSFIKLRPLVPLELRAETEGFSALSPTKSFELTPMETSRLLIEAVEAISSNKEKKGVEILLRAIRFGCPINRFALAGLLIRCSR